MSSDRILLIGLDGFEHSLAVQMMSKGELPALQKLSQASAQYLLDHGNARRTGLAWEHVSSGLSPDHGGRAAAVAFSRQDYSVKQQSTALAPFTKQHRTKTVVFDAPYFDLKVDPSTRGLVNWGAHDPGVEPYSNPPKLHDDIGALFGSYPATEWIYGFVWPSAEKTKTMAEALERAVNLRTDVAEWLLSKRLPDWELGILVVSEAHSALEAMWHGIDPKHPLHHLPSGPPAGEGVKSVYRAIDRLVARMTAAFPDALIITFAMHGMGPNDSDVANMALLPELLYRYEFGRPYMAPLSCPTNGSGLPMLGKQESWEAAMNRVAPLPKDSLVNVVRNKLHKLTARARNLPASSVEDTTTPTSLDWMPTARYRSFWPQMRAFALPAFYDGRIRFNMIGREARGKVPMTAYSRTCDEIETLLRGCRDALTGAEIVSAVYRSGGDNPLELDEAGSDMIVVWKSSPLGLVHPQVGQIGPLPYRRTGGHTGEHGFAWVSGPQIRPGQRGVRSSFDVVPTVTHLLGGEPIEISGRSLLIS